MGRVTVPNECNSIKMADGTIYRVDRGHAELSDKHMAQMKTSAARNNLDMIIEAAPPTRNQPDRFCPKCLFNNVAWVNNCVSCGTALS